MAAHSNLKQIVEAALMAAGSPLNLEHLLELFAEEERPDRVDLRNALNELQNDYQERGVELSEVGSGYRIQVRQAYAPWVSRLWEERPARYSRAMLETLALIAYRQPITRGEIEDIRGVSVSSNIIKTMIEREWIRVVGQRDVPGRPSLYATTRSFLDYFGLKSLSELPTLQEIRDLESINRELELDLPGEGADSDEDEPASAVDSADLPERDEQGAEPALPGITLPVAEPGEGTEGAAAAVEEAVPGPDPVGVESPLAQHDETGPDRE